MSTTQPTRYLMAVVLVAGTVIVRFLLHEVVEVQIDPFVLFILPTLLSAWFYGRGPGLVATGLSAILIHYFFTGAVSPYVLGGSSSDYLSLGIFIIEGSIISIFAGAKKETERTTDKLDIGLKERDVERTEQLDVTSHHLDRATKRLQEIEALSVVGSATSRIAHEIANPLNGMFTSAQLLERLLARGELDKATDVVKHLQTALQGLKSLLGEIREFSRPMTLNLAPVSLAAITNEVLSAQFLNAQEIQIERQFSPDLPFVIADKEKLKGALLNLSKNAVEAMPKGGKLTLRGYVREKTVCLELEDTGIGIPEGMKIFEPFITSKHSGWGLGLSNVLQVIAAHGGTIEYVSQVGHGTVFKVCLPVAQN